MIQLLPALILFLALKWKRSELVWGSVLSVVLVLGRLTGAI